MRVRLLIGAVLASVAAAAPARADTSAVNIVDFAFTPPQVTVLAGDTVGWRNSAIFNLHTVTGAGFDSGPIVPGGGFFHDFTDPGPHLYACTIHSSMTGEVDVYRLLLTGPSRAVARGAATSLTGRVSAGVGPVSIEEDTGAGFHPVASAHVDAGTLHAIVRPKATATYRAVAGADASAPVQVLVTDISQFKVKKLRRRLSVHVDPVNPGARISLQFKLRERFGWWTVARARLDRESNASFPLRLRDRRSVQARVVLTLSDGWTELAVSDPVRVRMRQHG
jgi:plastocyanin